MMLSGFMFHWRISAQETKPETIHVLTWVINILGVKDRRPIPENRRRNEDDNKKQFSEHFQMWEEAEWTIKVSSHNKIISHNERPRHIIRQMFRWFYVEQDKRSGPRDQTIPISAMLSFPHLLRVSTEIAIKLRAFNLYWIVVAR